MHPRRICLYLAASIAAVISAGCYANEFNAPDGAVQFDPPPIYTTWWNMVQTCAGRVGPLSDVTWYEVPDDANLTANGWPAEGIWDPGWNAIVVRRRVRSSGSVIRHEMLHSIARVPFHSRHYYLDLCGGIVGCPLRCIEEAGPYPLPPSSVPRVTPADLTITSAVEPLTATGEVDGPFFRVIVSVHNPATHAVVVTLPPPSTFPEWSMGFSFRVTGTASSGYGEAAMDAGMTVFAAGETKRHVYDFVVSPVRTDAFSLPPGTYQFVGQYGERSGGPLAFVIPK